VCSHTASEASAAHCWLGALEMEMGIAPMGHRALREPVRQFNILILFKAAAIICYMVCAYVCLCNPNNHSVLSTQ